MPMHSPSQIAQKWQRNLTGATETIRTGVEAVTESPTDKAARQSQAYLQGVQRSVDKWERGLRRVTLEMWKQAMIQKGLNRISAGAAGGVSKMEDFMQEFLPHLERGLERLRSMPRGDIQQNIQRMVTMVEHNAEFRRTR